MRKFLAIILSSVLLVACSAVPGAAPASPGASSTTVAAAGLPTLTVDPLSAAVLPVGQPVTLVAHATDTVGVARLELRVGPVLVQTVTSPTPAGVPRLDAQLSWTPTAPGPVVLVVIAYRADGTPSLPTTLAVSVGEAGAASAETSPLPGSPEPGASASEVAEITPAPPGAPTPKVARPTRRPPTATATATPTTARPAALPDLVVNVLEAPETATDGEKVGLIIEIKNIGAEDAGPFKVGVGDSFPNGGGGASPKEISGLAAGKSTNFSFPYTLSSPTEHTITVIADVDKQIAESNETNNAKSVTTTVAAAALPDLFCGPVVRPQGGRSVVLVISCLNHGYGAAGPFSIYYSYGYKSENGGGGTSATEFKSAGLPSGESVVLRPRFDLPSPGHYTFFVLIDPLKQVAETNEDNNEAKLPYDQP